MSYKINHKLFTAWSKCWFENKNLSTLNTVLSCVNGRGWGWLGSHVHKIKLFVDSWLLDYLAFRCAPDPHKALFDLTKSMVIKMKIVVMIITTMASVIAPIAAPNCSIPIKQDEDGSSSLCSQVLFTHEANTCSSRCTGYTCMVQW